MTYMMERRNVLVPFIFGDLSAQLHSNSGISRNEAWSASICEARSRSALADAGSLIASEISARMSSISWSSHAAAALKAASHVQRICQQRVGIREVPFAPCSHSIYLLQARLRCGIWNVQAEILL
eukprot:CAMPEP_0183353086 /NCGR_PEP_ID=MMETSP0164_2-20130417/32668_1 /TAXON_ID=221442 /ORGANISM="Coccolithus pelagicus ssp braarudi, Strain PLY182g" /LENGTH=124 /DNA_ID=CAMNT_0025525705 /DNA_START=13 /DNA_END=386 /DNA_ORIENTATION=+